MNLPFIKTLFSPEENNAVIERQTDVGKDKSSKVFVIFILACISLACVEYLGKNDGFNNILHFLNFLGYRDYATRLNDSIHATFNTQLFSLAYWVIIIQLFYVLFPVIVIKTVFREKLSDYGFQTGRLLKEFYIYLAFFLFMVPVVLFFSRTESFQMRYPFYHLQQGEPLWPNFWYWQFMYFFQFIAVEFFFRGFLVHGLKKTFGFYSVLIMTIPYCMIHFGKPFPETIAAIIAGIILGTLSLRTRTIWMGVAIHYSVALSMDLAAVWQKGLW